MNLEPDQTSPKLQSPLAGDTSLSQMSSYIRVNSETCFRMPESDPNIRTMTTTDVPSMKTVNPNSVKGSENLLHIRLENPSNSYEENQGTSSYQTLSNGQTPKANYQPHHALEIKRMQETATDSLKEIEIQERYEEDDVQTQNTSINVPADIKLRWSTEGKRPKLTTVKNAVTENATPGQKSKRGSFTRKTAIRLNKKVINLNKNKNSGKDAPISRPLDFLHDFIEYQRNNPELCTDFGQSTLSSNFKKLQNGEDPGNTFFGKFVARLGNFYKKKTSEHKRRRSFKEKVLHICSKLKNPITPDGVIRLTWDAILIILVTIDMVLIPLQISFSILDELLPFEILLDIVFLLDLLLSFHTAYYHFGNLVTSHSKIAVQYLKTWLLLDLVSSLPFSVFAAASPQDLDDNSVGKSSFFTICRILRVLKILKFFKVGKIFLKIKSSFSLSRHVNGLFQLLKLLTIVLILAHWLACGWHFIAVLEAENPENRTWLEAKELSNMDAVTKYLYSLYWSVTTMLTVGYGDISPVSVPEVIFAIFSMLVGCGVFAYSLNNIGSIIEGLTQDRLSFNVYAVNRFMKQNGVDPKIQKQVQGYLEHLIEEETSKQYYREEFLGLMPENLKNQILIDLNGKALTQNKIFSAHFDTKFLKELSTKLKEKPFCPGEVIYTEDSQDRSFYIITKGKVEIFAGTLNQSIRTLTAGDYFGEISLFSGAKRTSGVRSVNYSCTFYLEQEVFLAALERNEQQKEIYCQIHDKITILKDYSPLKVTCFACGSETHTIQYCPQLNYALHPQSVIQNMRNEEQEFMKNFERRTRPRFHAVRFKQTLSQPASQICLDYGDLPIFKVHDLEPDNNVLTKKDLQVNRHRSLNLLESEEKEESSEEEKDQVEDDLDASIMMPRANRARLTRALTKMNMTKEDITQFMKSIKQNPEREFVFERAKIFQNYFPHNNLDNVIKRVNYLNKIKCFNWKLEGKADEQNDVKNRRKSKRGNETQSPNWESLTNLARSHKTLLKVSEKFKKGKARSSSISTYRESEAKEEK